MAKAKATIDHETIQSWVEERDGCPAHVKGTGSGDDPGIIRIDYTGFSGTSSLEEISWEEFFEAFEANGLAFLYQDRGNGRFSKLVSRDSVQLEGDQKTGRGRSTRGKGATRTGRAAQGPDAIELLEEQHRKVEEAFEKLESARADTQKEKWFYKVADLLAAHAKIEETIFYPAVFDEDTEEELRRSVEEHLVAKRLIADMLDMEVSDPQFMSKAAVLREVVEHHIQEEESEMFPWVREMDLDDLNVLGKRMQSRFRELMQHEPHEEIPQQTQAAAPLG